MPTAVEHRLKRKALHLRSCPSPPLVPGLSDLSIRLFHPTFLPTLSDFDRFHLVDILHSPSRTKEWRLQLELPIQSWICTVNELRLSLLHHPCAATFKLPLQPPLVRQLSSIPAVATAAVGFPAAFWSNNQVSLLQLRRHHGNRLLSLLSLCDTMVTAQ